MLQHACETRQNAEANVVTRRARLPEPGQDPTPPDIHETGDSESSNTITWEGRLFQAGLREGPSEEAAHATLDRFLDTRRHSG